MMGEKPEPISTSRIPAHFALDVAREAHRIALEQQGRNPDTALAALRLELDAAALLCGMNTLTGGDGRER
jgi:hypothetical protein